MKYKNISEIDKRIPIPEERTESGVVRPVNHITIKAGEIEEIPDKAYKYAEGMGLVRVKAEESSIGKKIVETKQIEEPKRQTWSKKELYDMNKDEQVKILKAYDCEIPKYEKDRVELILLQQVN